MVVKSCDVLTNAPFILANFVESERQVDMTIFVGDMSADTKNVGDSVADNIGKCEQRVSRSDAVDVQSLYRSNQKPVDSAHRVTPTLIALIVLFTILVTPSNVITFASTTSGAYHTFETAARLTNFFLLSNFAVNFILYLVINAEFRRATRDLVTCRRAAGHHDAADDGGVGGPPRSRRWRTEAAGGDACRSTLVDVQPHRSDEVAGGGYRTSTDHGNPAVAVVAVDTVVYNISENEIAL